MLLKAPQVTTWGCLEIVDNILHEDKLPIVQPVATQFYVFTSSSIPAFLSKGVVVRQKNTGRRGFTVDYHAQITWIVTNNHEIIGISST